MFKSLLNHYDNIINKITNLNFIAPLLLRLYLAPIFISAGLNKARSFESTVAWFGNPDWGLGLPAPFLMALLATATEIIGGLFLIFGFAVRWVSLPLMFTMIVAIVSVHWSSGWFAIASSNAGTSMANPLATIGFPGASESLANSEQVASRLNAAKDILREHGNYDWLTETGNFVVLNNGIEFAVTYLFMLIALFFMGAGKFTSIDHLLRSVISRR